MSSPLVSVGFPVFNEEAHFATALDSILAQDYECLEVIVCDNASTDATAEIARDYEQRDPRVRLFPSVENEGAVANFNRCFRHASGPYFTWAGGHDTRLPAAIRRCVDVLEADRSLVLCYPRGLWQKSDGSTAPIEHETVETRGLPPLRRLRETIESVSIGNAVHGVIRSSALQRTRLYRRCHGADAVLLAELSLLGGFHQLDEALFLRTQNRKPETWEQAVQRTYDMLPVKTWFGRSRPHTAMLIEQAKGAWHVSTGVEKLSNALRAACYCKHRWSANLEAEWHLTGAIARFRAVVGRVRALAAPSRG
jgi:glycosyltransferase involved in cell wall biosynthesis